MSEYRNYENRHNQDDRRRSHDSRPERNAQSSYDRSTERVRRQDSRNSSQSRYSLNPDDNRSRRRTPERDLRQERRRTSVPSHENRTSSMMSGPSARTNSHRTPNSNSGSQLRSVPGYYERQAVQEQNDRRASRAEHPSRPRTISSNTSRRSNQGNQGDSRKIDSTRASKPRRSTRQEETSSRKEKAAGSSSAFTSFGSFALSKAKAATIKASEWSAKNEYDEIQESKEKQEATTLVGEANEASKAIATNDAQRESRNPEAEQRSERKKKKDEPSNEPILSENHLANAAPWRSYAVKAFSGVLTIGLVLGLLFFLRPSVSEVENRQLTEFPKFSVGDFLSGAWTDGVSTWYADTYPFRDQLISINQAFKNLYGFESSTQMYGSSVKADEIPTEAKEEKTPKKKPVAPETYDSWNLEEDIQGQIMQGLYVDNGTVYATYGFTQEAADDYVNALNSVSDKLDGVTQVYSILIPNNSGVMLSKNELAALGGSNQAQAIEYYYNSYNDKIKTVPTMDPLIKHKDDYIYFRTDHHWTSLGAYYVYQKWCEEKGIEPHDIESYEEKDFAPFLGSYYSQLQLDSLAANPDTVQAWIPKGTNDMKYTDVDNNTIDWNVIKDVSDWDQGTLYNCFVGGDQPWAEIHNPEITDGSSCVIVKESYGNAFAPWLVDHYEYVYIADFRYTNTNVADFCKEHEINDLILLNNISIIGSVDVAGKISSIL